MQMLQVDAVMHHSPRRAWLQKYLTDMLVARHWGTIIWHVSGPTQDAILVAKAQNCLSSVQESLRQLVMCLGRKVWLFWHKEAGLRAQHPVVKDLLAHELNTLPPSVCW